MMPSLHIPTIVKSLSYASLPNTIMSVPSTHKAVVTIAARAPLAILEVPTIQPVGREVLVHQQWTASTPLDLHQNDGGLLVVHPQVLGDGIGGTVVGVGPDVRNLAVGDKVICPVKHRSYQY